MSTPHVGSAVLHTAVFAVGLLLLYIGFRLTRFSRLVRNTPTASPGSAAAGRSEIRGRVEPFRDPEEAPFVGTECVCFEWTLEERIDEEWVEIARESHIEPFYLADEDGEVLVRADEYPAEELPWVYDSRRFQWSDRDRVDSFLASSRRQSGGGTGTNPAVTENPAVTANPAVTEQSKLGANSPLVGDTGDRWRYVVKLIPTEMSLYVFGSLGPQHRYSEFGVGPDDSTGTFVIARPTERWVSGTADLVGVTALAAGLLFTLWGGVSGLLQLLDLLSLG